MFQISTLWRIPLRQTLLLNKAVITLLRISLLPSCCEFIRKPTRYSCQQHMTMNSNQCLSYQSSTLLKYKTNFELEKYLHIEKWTWILNLCNSQDDVVLHKRHAIYSSGLEHFKKVGVETAGLWVFSIPHHCSFLTILSFQETSRERFLETR